MSFLAIFINSCPPISSKIKSAIISIDIESSLNNTVSIGAVFTGFGDGLFETDVDDGVCGVADTIFIPHLNKLSCLVQKQT